jgi:peptidoglycan hydrolase FlgJ
MMLNATNLSGNVAYDANSLNKLKLSARENSPEAVKDVAKQFEAIFMNMMLKSMREATPQDNPFDNEQSRTFTSMLDQQLSSNFASKGLGLADILAKQLSKSSHAVGNAMQHAITDVGPGLLLAATLISNPLSPNTAKATNADTMEQKINPADSAPILNKELSSQPINNKPLSGDAGEFKERMTEHAESASRATGLPAHLMLGQAALESGWGKREIKDVNGMPSNNLFGIKATSKWTGKVVETLTTEYVDGIKQKRIEKFRAYDSYADSFKDFANIMQNDPRYQNVMANLHSAKDYAQAMQKAGYATDPQYASKLASVIQKVSAS